jgi:exosortase H (IPTLxxWG-CTERM-specific)
VIRFIAVFCLILLVGLYLQTLPEVNQYFTGPWGRTLAMFSHWLIALVDADTARVGNVLFFKDGAFSVTVAAECSGVDPLIIFFAAVLAFPAPWKKRLTGLLLGLAVIQGLNLVRIISLFYLGRWNEALFVWAHHNLWQGLLILAALLTFIYWQGTLKPRNGS